MRSQAPSRQHVLGFAAASTLVVLACSKGTLENVNHMPVVLSVTHTPTQVFTGRPVVVRAEAVDEDGDPITYSWAADDGTFDLATGEAVTWTAPTLGGHYRIVLTASDGAASATAVHRVFVSPDQFAGQLTVDSDPRGAQIWLDRSNTFFQTAHTFDSLQVGEHDLWVTLPDRVLYPDTSVVLLREFQDTTLTYTFVTENQLNQQSGATVGIPQINFNASRVAWSANPTGPFEIYLNGPNEEPSSAQVLNTIGWDDDRFLPNWNPSGGTIGSVVFQSSVDDTGSILLNVGTAGGGGPIRRYDLDGDARRAAFNQSGAVMVFVRHEREGATYRTMLVQATDLTPTDPITATERPLLTLESTAGRIEISTPQFSSDELLLIYSRRQPGGSEDLYVYDLATDEERPLTSSGDRSWPTFATSERTIFFHKTDGSGVFGCSLDRTNWTLGRPMRLGPVGSRYPSFGSNTSGGGDKRVSYLVGDQVIVADDFQD